MTEQFRVPGKGQINADSKVSFTFDGKRLTGKAGDTLASALLANGIHLTGRSFKYHRPRGIMSAGIDEANALVTVGEGAYAEPNNRAPVVPLYDGLKAVSQNAIPSLSYDIGAVNQLGSKIFTAGFYYKTFMGLGQWGWDHVFEPVIRAAAGSGVAPKEADPDWYEKLYAFCDVLIAGAGPAGLSAALAAARTGARVTLVEQDLDLGGSLLFAPGEQIDGKPALEWVAAAEAELAGMENVTILKNSIVTSYYDHNYIGVWERLTNEHLPLAADQPRGRFHRTRAKHVVIASGALERPLVFSDNDRPGIMLAEAARAFLNRWGVLPGRIGVAVVNNDHAYAAICELQEAGAEIAAVVDWRTAPAGPNTEKAKAAGINILAGHTVNSTKGRLRVSSVNVSPVDGDEPSAAEAQDIACDFVIMSGGWNPAVHLHSQATGKLTFDDVHGCFVPATKNPANANTSAGAGNGAWSTGEALEQGFAAGKAAAADAGFKSRATKFPAGSDEGMGPIRLCWELPSTKGDKAKKFVDLQHDVKATDLRLALREGFESVEHVKRYTTLGMATDQGKTSNVNGLGILSNATGKKIPEIGTTTFRPPYAPVTFGAIAGRDIGDLLDPARATPMHAWHLQAGAKFEDVGQWKRAWFYPKAGEDMHAAVNREVKATRDSLGIMDASTLGKIDIKGPDAAEFVNRVYSNAYLKLAVGKCRYGLMLGEDGMIMDDGVTVRLAEDHFLMHTTTGGAANVLGHLEDYLQTEWTDLKVYLTSVTEQWATAAYVGPNSRRALEAICEGIDLSNEAFPFMSLREGTVAGIPARVMRISFSGEMAYEISVPSDYGLSLWDALIAAGRQYDITPYGTEAMHVLRGEKGFIIVGQDTDGSMTPFDMGLGGMVSKKKKDFIGKRGLARPDLQDPNRKQLVGIATDDPEVVIPEGTHLVDEVLDRTPMPNLGHVSSSYWSPSCNSSVAMALVKGGHSRMGDTVYAPTLDGRVIRCKIVSPVFFDSEGARQHA